jgi:large subunit ribosomal protein L23
MSKERFYNIIRGPAITEKGTLVSEKNQVVFNVAPRATKPQIKAAVEGLFGVKVKAVNTLIRKGKSRRFRGIPTILSDVKKAYVTLEEGQRLDVTTGL